MVRSDSAGVAIVTAGAEDAPLAWTLGARLSLGGEDEGPESFYMIGQNSVGSDAAGRLYVLDGVAHRVVVFDRDGALLRTLGRQGGGPGELTEAGTLAVSADGAVAVFDFGKAALVRWDSAGQAGDEIRFIHFPTWNGRHFALLPDGFVVSRHGLNEHAARANDLAIMSGADTVVLASLLQPNSDTPAMFPACGGGVNFPPMFTPHVVWHHSGGITAVAPDAAYRIDLYRGNSLVLSIRRSIPPVPATRELAILDAGEGFRINFGQGPCLVPPDEYADARGWAETVPAIADLALTPDGGLWVQRRVPGEERPPIDVFDADGAYRGTLPPGTPFPALLLHDGAIGVITTDDDDVDRLSVLEVVRESGS